MTKKVSIKKKL